MFPEYFVPKVGKKHLMLEMKRDQNCYPTFYAFLNKLVLFFVLHWGVGLQGIVTKHDKHLPTKGYKVF